MTDLALRETPSWTRPTSPPPVPVGIHRSTTDRVLDAAPSYPIARELSQPAQREPALYIMYDQQNARALTNPCWTSTALTVLGSFLSTVGAQSPDTCHTQLSPHLRMEGASSGLYQYGSGVVGTITVVAQDSNSKRVAPVATLIDHLQIVAAVTLEELAPLVGVSRRSLQNWRAGEKISARNERHLRDLVDALTVIANDAERNNRQVRDIILSRASSGLRPYDLLASRQWEPGIELAKLIVHEKIGSRQLSLHTPPPDASLPERLGLLVDDAIGPATGRLSGRFSRRLNTLR